MKDNLYELSDCLFQLRRWIAAEASKEGLTLDARQVGQLDRLLFVCGQSALKQAHEISRHRWNAAAHADRDRDDRVIEEAMRPGTNVALFPAIDRPFSDGRPGGAA